MKTPEDVADLEWGGTVEFRSWQLNLESGELFKDGVPVRLQPQPSKVLCLLVSRSGALVLREEIYKALWDGETFVDFEGGLNYCIRQIRSVLSERADQPVFIATIPRRGYRFVAEVKPASQVRLLVKAHPEQKSAMLVEPKPVANRLLAPRWIVAALLLGLVAVSLVLRWRRDTSGEEMAAHVISYTRLTDDARLKDIDGSLDPLISDGKQIFFNEAVKNQSLLASVPISGGEVSLHPMPYPSAGVVGYSPSTGELLFASTWHNPADGYLIAKSLKSGITHRLSRVVAHDASWSADGQHLAFTRGSDVFVTDDSGTHERKIASVRGATFWPRWSPDGRTIRFSESPGGFQFHLWEVAATGLSPHMLLQESSERNSVCCGSWMKEGRYFVYLSFEPNRSDLWAISTERRSAHPVRLTAGLLDLWRGVLPGADGRHLFATGEQLRGRLMRVDPATRKPIPYLNEISAEGVSFSPDNEWIAYTAFPEGTLWRSRLDGAQKMRLTASSMLARFPRWSPDGKTIAFLATTLGSPWMVYEVSAAGAGLHPVLEERSSQGVPTWGPNGRSLAFGGLSFGQSKQLDIRIIELKTNSVSVLPGSQGLWTPRWSPDGKYFAAITADNQTLRLYDARAREWSDLVSFGANDVVWSPDSRFIFFDSTYGAKPGIYRVRLADRKTELWASLADVRRAGFFSPWLGIAPDGNPILLADAGIQELYSLLLALP